MARPAAGPTVSSGFLRGHAQLVGLEMSCDQLLLESQLAKCLLSSGGTRFCIKMFIQMKNLHGNIESLGATGQVLPSSSSMPFQKNISYISEC